ncbi:MAG: ribonuclease P protein component [Rickettsiales bacterium]|nr:ribonuclease P protein component [Rickettsiales bacterium]
MVVKKSSTKEDKREEKFCLPKKINKLKKRSDFLDLRNNCIKLFGSFVILNFSKRDGVTKYGLTVSKKIGNAVKRNYVKRVIRSIIRNNWFLIKEGFEFEIIPKKEFLQTKYIMIENDVKKLINKMNF